MREFSPEQFRGRRMSVSRKTYEANILPANKLVNVQRRVNRARSFPRNTCPASRHVHIMADALASGRAYHMFAEEPHHCAGSLYSVLESLWKARTELARLRAQIDQCGDVKNAAPERGDRG